MSSFFLLLLFQSIKTSIHLSFNSFIYPGKTWEKHYLFLSNLLADLINGCLEFLENMEASVDSFRRGGDRIENWAWVTGVHDLSGCCVQWTIGLSEGWPNRGCWFLLFIRSAAATSSPLWECLSDQNCRCFDKLIINDHTDIVDLRQKFIFHLLLRDMIETFRCGWSWSSDLAYIISTVQVISTISVEWRLLRTTYATVAAIADARFCSDNMWRVNQWVLKKKEGQLVVSDLLKTYNSLLLLLLLLIEFTN